MAGPDGACERRLRGWLIFLLFCYAALPTSQQQGETIRQISPVPLVFFGMQIICMQLAGKKALLVVFWALTTQVQWWRKTILPYSSKLRSYARCWPMLLPLSGLFSAVHHQQPLHISVPHIIADPRKSGFFFLFFGTFFFMSPLSSLAALLTDCQ